MKVLKQTKIVLTKMIDQLGVTIKLYELELQLHTRTQLQNLDPKDERMIQDQTKKVTEELTKSRAMLEVNKEKLNMINKEIDGAK